MKGEWEGGRKGKWEGGRESGMKGGRERDSTLTGSDWLSLVLSGVQEDADLAV